MFKREHRNITGLPALGPSTTQQHRAICKATADGYIQRALRPPHQSFIDPIGHMQCRPDTDSGAEEPIKYAVVKTHGRSICCLPPMHAAVMRSRRNPRPEQVRILPGRMAGCRRAGILPAGVYIDELTRTG